MPAIFYPAVIDRSATGFGVTFPDFPGCIANGDSPSEAVVSAEAALALHLGAREKDGDPIPEPSDIGDIEDVEGADDDARVLVRVDRPAKITRVLVSIDENLLRVIDSVAPNRSAFLSEAARSALRQRIDPHVIVRAFSDLVDQDEEGEAGTMTKSAKPSGDRSQRSARRHPVPEAVMSEPGDASLQEAGMPARAGRD